MSATKVRCFLISIHWPEKSPAHLRPGTLLSLGYFNTLFIIVCGLYPCAMAKETASLISVNSVDPETQQPENAMNKDGLCSTGDNCCCQHIEGKGDK